MTDLPRGTGTDEGGARERPAEVLPPNMDDVCEADWPALLTGRTITHVETRATGFEPRGDTGAPNVARLHFADGGVVDVDMIGYDGDVELAASPPFNRTGVLT